MSFSALDHRITFSATFNDKVNGVGPAPLEIGFTTTKTSTAHRQSIKAKREHSNCFDGLGDGAFTTSTSPAFTGFPGITVVLFHINYNSRQKFPSGPGYACLRQSPHMHFQCVYSSFYVCMEQLSSYCYCDNVLKKGN